MQPKPLIITKSPSRARLLSVAQKCFAAHGYRRTSIAQIAHGAGVAAGTVYRYFKDKEDVFREVVRDLHAQWLARARAAVAEPGTAVERLARMGRVSVEFDRENSLIGSIFRRDTEIIFAPLLEELHARLSKENVALIAEIVRDGIRDGSFRPIDPERAAYVLFIAGDALANQRERPYDELLPVYSDILLHGLVPR